MASCLVIKNDGLGDLILSSGVIASLSKIFDGNLDLVTCDANREIAENLYGVRRCYYVSRGSIGYRRQYPKIPLLRSTVPKEDRDILNSIKSTHYDVAISLRRFITTSTLVLMEHVNATEKHCAWQFPTDARWDFAKSCSKGWRRFSGPLETLPETLYYQAFIKDALGEDIEIQPRLRSTDAIEPAPEPKTMGIGLGGRSSQWPTEHWISFLQPLVREGWQVHLFGGGDAEATAQAIQQQIPNCKNHVAKISLSETLTAISTLQAFISNDTGIIHLASLIVPKCMVILGGGTFQRFLPWPGETKQYAVTHKLPCFDCDWECKFESTICLEKIAPQDALSFFREILETDDLPNLRNVNPEDEEYQTAWKRLSKHDPNFMQMLKTKLDVMFTGGSGR